MAEVLSAEHRDQNKRLDRIEDKLDRLSDAVVSIARAEEKISSLMISVQAQNETMIAMNRRVDSIEKKVDGNASTINTINRLFWILTAAAVTTISTLIITQTIQ